ncbi:MAG: dihydrodipicolinate synthase family protein, partial [Bacilli bacterium]
LICGLAAGADGAIGSTYNMMLPLYKQLLKAFNDGDMNKATEIQYKANSVTTKLMNHSVLPAIKHCLETIGFEVGNATYPMRWLSDEEKSIINAEMKEVGWPFK